MLLFGNFIKSIYKDYTKNNMEYIYDKDNC